MRARITLVAFGLGLGAIAACESGTTDPKGDELADGGASSSGSNADGGGCPRVAPAVDDACDVAFASCEYSTGDCVTSLSCTNGRWAVGTVKCPPDGGSRCELAGGRCSCDCALDESPGEGQLGDACARSASCIAQMCCFPR